MNRLIQDNVLEPLDQSSLGAEVDWARRQLGSRAATAAFCIEPQLPQVATDEITVNALPNDATQAAHTSKRGSYTTRAALDIFPAEHQREVAPPVVTALPTSSLEIRRLRRSLMQANSKTMPESTDEDKLIRYIVGTHQQIPTDTNETTADMQRSLAALKECCYGLIQSRSKQMTRQIISRHMWKPDDYPDLIAVTNSELYRIICNFDPSYTNTFMAYARAGLIGSVRRYYRDRTMDTSLQTRDSYEKSHKLNTALKEGIKLATIAEEMKLSEEEAREILDYVKLHGTFDSLDTGDNKSRLDSWDSGVITPEQQVAGIILDDEIQQALQGLSLTPRELTVMTHRFGVIKSPNGQYINSPFPDPKSQIEIAKFVGVSQVHVGRIMDGIVQRLKNALGVAEVVDEVTR